METDRKGLKAVAAVFTAFLVYDLLAVLTGGVAASPAYIAWRVAVNLPQILWWFAAGFSLALVSTPMLMRMLSKLRRQRRVPPPDPSFPGRVASLRRRLAAGEDARTDIQSILASIAIDLIALRHSLPRAEAARLFHGGRWSDDPVLKAYFASAHRRRSGRGLFRLFRCRARGGAGTDALWRDTAEALERLRHFGGFDTKGNHEFPSHEH